MAQLLGLSPEQMARIRPLFLKEPGMKRVDDRQEGVARHHPCDPERSALGGCPGGRWPPQNPRQPLPPLVRQGCF